MGFSTRIAARMFEDTINIPNTQSIIIAQDEDNSKRLFQMVKRFYDNLPENKKLKLGTDSKTELWWPQIDSYFAVGWAGSKKVGRGSTINNLHGSEVAFWEDAGPLISGIMQSIPQDGNIFLESTANGIGNYFYKEYQDAGSGKSIFKDRFYPWFLEPGYRADSLVGGGVFVRDSEEEELAQRYNLDDQQLIWRRNKILELKNAMKSGENVGTFPQEYPCNPDEAFMITGSTYFDNNKIINELIPRTPNEWREILPPLWASNLRRVRDNPRNQFDIWVAPQSGHRYIITADPSEGINTDDLHDYCSSDIIDVETWEQVGVLHGRWEPFEYAGLLYELGKWYNNALIVVERNNHGHAVLTNLINHYGYPSMEGYSGVYAHRDYDSTRKSKQSTLKPGYPNNVKTKAIALGALYTVTSDGSLNIKDKRGLKQMLTFAKLPGGKLGALSGHHDDKVLSLALGAAVLTDVEFNNLEQKITNKRKSRIITGKSLKRVGRIL